ncbi:hypothetical protein, partial [Thiolapillus sp.]
MTRTAGAQIGCQRPSRFWGLGCPKIYHEAEDTLDFFTKMAVDAQQIALKQVDFILDKARFFGRFSGKLNARQQ